VQKHDVQSHTVLVKKLLKLFNKNWYEKALMKMQPVSFGTGCIYKKRLIPMTKSAV